MSRESFIFYQSFHKALEPLEPESYKNVMIAINNYALYGLEPELNGIENSFFILIRPQLDANNKRYIDGQKGGRPKKTSGYEDNEKPVVIENEDNEKPNVNVNDNVNVNVIDNGKRNENPAKALFLNYWQHNPDIFNSTARFDDFDSWERYWSTSPPTYDQVDIAMKNFIADVQCGAIGRKYIPRKPDKFVLNGWIVTCQERQGQVKATSPPENFGKSWQEVLSESA